MDVYHSLPVRSLSDTPLKLARSDAHAGPGDPASTVFTDLRIAPSVVVPADETLDDARRLMIHAGVRMAFVLDAAGDVVGLVTAADLHGERPMLVAMKRSTGHGDLDVTDVMTPVAQWSTLEVERMGMAQVGDIVATFRASGERYLIVTEADPAGSGARVIRGLFSANRVERAIGHAIEDELRTRSFASLATVLAHH